MKSLKITIRPLSSFKTEFQSDTLFGVFAWVFLYLNGESKLNKLLADYEGNPSIIFSDGYPEGYLPIPMRGPVSESALRDILRNDSSPVNEEDIHGILKKFKKMRFVREAMILELIDRGELSTKNVFKKIFTGMHEQIGGISDYTGERTILFKRTDFIKNSVNRLTNTTQEGLYQSRETFYNTPIVIYAKLDPSVVSVELIKNVFEVIGETGFGADKTVGKGCFELTDIEEDFKLKNYIDAAPNKGKKQMMTLSTGIIKEGDESIDVEYARTFTKFGKLGKGFKSSELPFKNPVVMFRSGSTFGIKKVTEYYGSTTRDVFVDRKGYQSGYVIPLFF